MRLVPSNLKPTSGFAHFLHLALVLVLPVAVFVLVRLDFVQLGLSIIVLSKWRMFAVRPRFWPANVRANAVDMMVGLSVVLFMSHSGSVALQVGLAALYAVWLALIKPASDVFMVTAQAFIGQLSALMALYLTWADGPIYGLTFMTGLICFLAARHFLDAFEEPFARMLAYTWGYFGAALAWLLSHVLLAYPYKSASDSLAQPVILLSAVGYGLGVVYYLEHFDRLSKIIKRETIAVIFIIALALITSLFFETRHLIT